MSLVDYLDQNKSKCDFCDTVTDELFDCDYEDFNRCDYRSCNDCIVHNLEMELNYCPTHNEPHERDYHPRDDFRYD